MSKQEQKSTEISGLLGISSRFEGEIRFDGTLRIDGVVNGKILCKNDLPSKVVITEMAVVEADIAADIVIISGQVAGNVKAIERLEIHAPGRLEGLVYTGDLSIADGALFQGECVMIRHMSKREKAALKMEHFYEIHHHTNSISRQSIQDPSEVIPLNNNKS